VKDRTALLSRMRGMSARAPSGARAASGSAAGRGFSSIDAHFGFAGFGHLLYPFSSASLEVSVGSAGLSQYIAAMPVPSIPQSLIERLDPARSICVFTGAGMSAESGIPTFRSPGGLWERFQPEELATPAAFAVRPQTVWEWYQHRRRIIAEAKPHPGHRAIADLKKRCARVAVATQNVDGFHQRAGSDVVYELHGSIHRIRCQRCQTRDSSPSLADSATVPRCRCGGLLRPDVVWFGETLPEAVFEAALSAAVSCEVFLSVGTSSIVYPAAGLIDAARDAGAFLIEINPEATERSVLFDVALRGAAGKILPELCAVVGVTCNETMSPEGTEQAVLGRSSDMPSVPKENQG